MTETAKKLSKATLVAGLIAAGLLTAYFLNPSNAEADDAQAQASEATTDEETEEVVPIPVEVSTVEQGRIAAYISSTANLVPENQVPILAEWEGRVADLKVEEGDAVTKGAVLAELDREEGEIAVQKARVRAETQRLAFERSRQLHEQELLSSEAFDKIKLEHEVAQQELAEAEWRLEKTFIRAPFSGKVTQRTTQLGQHVRPGDELFTIADFDPLVARIYLPESDVLSLDEGRSVRISLRADDDIVFDGRIRQISPVVDTATGTVKVTVESRQPPRQVRPGAFVRIDIERESVADATLVPREAVIRELKRAFAFVAKDGVAEKRTLQLGLEEGDLIQALEGIAPGEQIVVAGQGGLEDGAAIKLLDTGDDTTRLASR